MAAASAASAVSIPQVKVGVDVGGTKVLGIAVVSDGAGAPEVIHSARRPADAGGVDVVERIAAVVAAVVDAVDARRISSVGVGLAGLVGLDGVVVQSPNAPGLVGVDVAARVGEVLDVPVHVDNDANCVAVATARLRDPAVSDLVAVTLGTGIGGGIVMGGRLLRGHRGYAGEPGHMVVDPDGPDCPCGQNGCWERYASGAGLAMLAARRLRADPSADFGVDDPAELRGEHVTAAMARGSLAAGEVWDDFARWVALGVANLVALVDPEVVVLGGGLVAEGAGLVDRVNAHLQRFPLAAARGVVTEAAPSGPAAGAVGAALLASEVVTGWGAGGGRH